MEDIQVVRLIEVVDVRTIENAQGVSPRSLIITGGPFSEVEKVIMNGFPSPEFFQLDTRRLIAQVPTNLVDQPISDVMVLSAKASMTSKSLVELSFGTRPRKLEGIQKLVQSFIRLLLRTPRTNIFHPRSGGGLPRLIGKTISANLDETRGDVTLAVSRVRQYLLSTQASNRRIPPSERLLNARVVSVDLDLSSTTLSVTVLVESQAGETAGATLVR